VTRRGGVLYSFAGHGYPRQVTSKCFTEGWRCVDSRYVRPLVGYRQLIARAHKNGIRVIGTTIPPFEHALFREPLFEGFYSPEREKSRQEVNTWIRNTREFDGVIDFDAAVRDPNRPTELLPAYDSGDHLHVNDAGNVAQGNAIPLALFVKQ